MSEPSGADQLHGSLSGAAPSSRVHSRRIDRRELRLLGGMIVALIGVALLITTQATLGYSSEGWFLIAAAAFIAVGFMLIGSGMTGRASRLGEALFVATPGGLLAAVGYIFVQYLQPFNFSLIFEFTWVGLAFLGLLWIIVGPIFMYRAKTRLWVGTSDPSVNESVAAPNPEPDRSGSRLVVATWFLVLATLLGSIISALLIHFLDS